MLQRGYKFILAACAVAVMPSSAFSQNVIPLDANAPQATLPAAGGVAADATTRTVMTANGVAYRVDVFGAQAGPGIVVAQNLVTPNGAAPVPNVNDCTFIRDPIALRDCVNLYEGQRLAPGPRISEPRTNVVTDKDLIDAAGPIPGSGKGSAGHGDAINPADTSRSGTTYIEQVSPPR